METHSSFSGAEFIYPWRNYQERILGNLDKYLEDKKIHIIAPPGSGKTVLGLEIMRRLGKKTIVLSPTLAIRDQWIGRWNDNFQPDSNHFSTDLRAVSNLYSTTYQSVYSLFKREFLLPECDVLVVDEAHHLRREWFRALEELVKVSNPIIVALTATPPWDVPDNELKNYLELCGEVDEEISVPELVATGDLCPHQDYLYMNYPDEEASRHIRNFQNVSIQMVDSIPRLDWIGKFLDGHPYFKETENHWDDIYKDTENFLSLVVLWKATGRTIPLPIQEVLESERIQVLPEWNRDYATIFIQSIIHSEKIYPSFASPIKELRTELRKKSLLHGRKVDFSGKNTAHRFLTEGSSKISGILEILKREVESMGSDTRCLILTDYIRKEQLIGEENSLLLGTIPIYKSIFPDWGETLNFCHISGSLILVPDSTVIMIQEKIPEAKFREVSGIIGAKEWMTTSQIALPVLTDLFNQGSVKGIVGTMSLLGEGWDAPAINLLILATSVGSYMLSNQSRGRAIRIDKNNLSKTSNVWHLILVEPGAWEGDFEFTEMERRFRAFAGPSFNEPISIETGLQRMNLSLPGSMEDVEAFNESSFTHAIDRPRLTREWTQGIASGESFAERLVVKGWDDPYRGESSSGKSFSIFGVFTLLESLLLYLGYLGQSLLRDSLWAIFGKSQMTIDFTYLLFLPFLLLLPRWYRSLRHLMVWFFWDNTKKKIADVTGNCLVAMNLVDKNSEIAIHYSKKEDGSLQYTAQGGLLREREYLIRSLEQIMAVPDNPRYLLATSTHGFRFCGRTYITVPEVMGRRKESAELFQKHWEKLLGKSELIYTRTPVGRISLFRSRIQSIFRSSIQLERGGIWI